ncbi:ABC transporter permease [Ornithinibacillus halophilus]|uniref:ABC-2 type transport system permease protein n=1 Tax=Ornithinibacillus halophilus TaxID=930117 RepID=A0A1M5KXD3_9BACI|nr:ABC transporter permease [Ornithinibacillus halophilus]SHG57330.1 ABC-2 type transport system permease protein [Ornithinibacillus halophilus]
MSFSLKRINAIFQKDLKDLSKNMYIGSIIVLPILMAFLYSIGDGETPILLHYLVINLALSSVTAFIQCAVIAEEKEKNTLRGLMLSPASLTEILTGKSLVSLILTVVTIALCMVITGYEPTNLPLVILAIFVASLFFLALGTLLGLLTRSIIEASVVILPFIFLFGFGSMAKPFIEEITWLKFMEYLPNSQLEEIAYGVEVGAGFSDILENLAIILVWVLVGVILTIFVYKKRELD